MKDLRKLLRRTRWLGPKHHRLRDSRSRRGDGRRRLRNEALEKRQLLAGDIAFAHNYWHPADVDANQEITARDALLVVNHLSREGSGTPVTAANQLNYYADVNADGKVSAVDALGVINALDRGESAGELVELLLNGRDINDDALSTPQDRTINVEVGEVFFLELSYSDFRNFGGDRGAFEIRTDIGVSDPNVIRPVLTETQLLVLEENIRDASSGTVTISREGSATEFTATLAEIADDPDSVFEDAVVAFGFQPDQFELTRVRNPLLATDPFPGQTDDEANENIVYQIRYTDFDEFAFQDIPNIQISTSDFVETVRQDPSDPGSPLIEQPLDVRAKAEAKPPVDDDGNLDFSVLADNFDLRSRSFPDAGDPFGREVYGGAFKFGAFDPVTGFDSVGVVGPFVTDIDEFVGDFPEPFDTFSIPVVATQPVNDYELSLNISDVETPVTLYTDPDDDDAISELPPDLVLLDTDATITINVTGEAVNDPPVVSDPVTQTISEDNPDTSVDLLAGASDPNGDELSVANLAVTEGDASGIVFDPTNNELDVTPNTYNGLAAGESEVVEYAYDVIDGRNGSVAQVATITITGENDAPTADDTNVTATEGQTLDIDVSSLIGDPDGDSLTVLPGDTAPANGSVTISGTTISYTPSVPGPATDSFTYKVNDGTVDSQQATIDVSITEVNDPPVVEDPVTAEFSEDDPDAPVDLLAGASDPENDTLSVTDVSLVSGDDSGIVIDEANNELDVTPGAYNSLADGESETIIYSYNVDDGGGNSVSQSATVTINGANDAPTAGPQNVTTPENESVEIDVSNLIGDPDGDSLNVMLGAVTPTNGTVTLSGTTFTYTPSVAGPASDSFTYKANDGTVDSEEATISVTIEEFNDPPVVEGPVTADFSEDDPDAPVDLLAGASDPENDTLSVTDVSLVSGDDSGIVIDEANNELDVTPGAYNSLAAGESETIIYSYNVDDGGGNSVSQSATITINGANDAPTAGPQNVTTPENESVEIDVSNLIGDPDGDSLNVMLGSVTPTNGTVTLSGTTFTYTPSVAGPASDSFTYKANDGTVDSEEATISVTIEEFNDPPVVEGPVTADFSEDDPDAPVDLLAGASDPENDTLSVTDVSLVSGDDSGIVIDEANNELDVTPGAYNSLAAGESETIIYSYNVDDGGGNSVSQSATVTINGANDAPTASPTTVATPENESVEIDVSNLIDDPDGDSLNAMLGSVTPTNGTVTLSGTTFTYTPSVAGPASDSFTYKANDGTVDSEEATISVTIEEFNDPPVVEGPVTADFSEDDPDAPVDLLAGASDPENDTLSVTDVSLVSGDDSGIVIDEANNELDVTPGAYNSLAAGESETIIYSYNVDDGGGNSVSQSATVTINGANDAPTAVSDTASTVKNTAVVIDVLGNDTDPDINDSLTVVDTSSSNAVIITEDGRTKIRYTPATDFTGTDSFTYTISDGAETSQATVEVTVNDFQPSTISGDIFFDHVENIDEVVEEGANAIRNGVKDPGESGLGGAPVKLVSAAGDNVTGSRVEITAYTSLHGGYSFENVAPGTYEVIFEIPETIVFGANADGSAEAGVMEIIIGAAGGEQIEDKNFTLIDTQGSALGNIDILSSSFLRANPDVAQDSRGGREGGLVSLSETGEQEFFIADRGYDGIRFAELALSESRDSALLTVIDEQGEVLTARLNDDDFVVNAEGTAVQFFGGMEDFNFAPDPANAVTEEFDDYRDAIDKVIGELGNDD